MISALFLIAGNHSTTKLKTYEQAKISLSQQIHRLHLKNPLWKNVKRHFFPFHGVQHANTENLCHR